MVTISPVGRAIKPIFVLGEEKMIDGNLVRQGCIIEDGIKELFVTITTHLDKDGKVVKKFERTGTETTTNKEGTLKTVRLGAGNTSRKHLDVDIENLERRNSVDGNPELGKVIPKSTPINTTGKDFDEFITIYENTKPQRVLIGNASRGKADFGYSLMEFIRIIGDKFKRIDNGTYKLPPNKENAVASNQLFHAV